MTNHIVLFEPRIPQNTGNIARTATATNSVLHLIRPLGFEVTDRNLKRAGLDYWENVELRYYDGLTDFMASLAPADRLFLITKFAEKDYTDIDYAQAPADKTEGDIYFLFGREDTGLPENFMRENEDKCLRIPMNDTHVRSLNLSNCVALVIYEALRQQDFAGLERVHTYEKDKLKG